MLFIKRHYALQLFSAFGPSVKYYFALKEDIVDLNIAVLLMSLHIMAGYDIAQRWGKFRKVKLCPEKLLLSCKIKKFCSYTKVRTTSSHRNYV